MTRGGLPRAVVVGLWLAASTAAGEEAREAPAPEVTSSAPSTSPPDAAELQRRLEQLEAQNRELREQIAQLRQDVDATREQVQQVQPLAGRFSGYFDFGFFTAQGGGSGIIQDVGHYVAPEFADLPWVFLGDPLSTAINSRGEPADATLSRAITFDPLRTGGVPSFLVNAVNLALLVGVGESLTLHTMVDFLPRGRRALDAEFPAVGDFLDVKLAYAEYVVPSDSLDLTLSAGKFDPVVGYEYRSQESPDRMTITPSLACRYTCGRPLGLKARGRFLDRALIVNVAVTNGSSFKENFDFYDESDSNAMKTLSGRVSYALPVGAGLELGLSGAVGAQDLQRDNGVWQHHLGADLHLLWEDLEVTAEYVRGRAPGRTGVGQARCEQIACIEYQAAYGLAGYRMSNWLMPYLRVDWRDATHAHGADFLYLTRILRGTVGARLELGPQVVVKAEYVLNAELDPLPQFPNDVLTSSLVVTY